VSVAGCASDSRLPDHAPSTLQRPMRDFAEHLVFKVIVFSVVATGVSALTIGPGPAAFVGGFCLVFFGTPALIVWATRRGKESGPARR